MLCPEFLAKTQSARSEILYDAYFYGRTLSTEASLSRAYRRLEARGLIQKCLCKCELTNEVGTDRIDYVVPLLEAAKVYERALGQKSI